METVWYQEEIRLPALPRGCHLVTGEVTHAIRDPIRSLRVGLVHVFICHTSASLALNENADPDVPSDMTMALNHLVPESLPYDHTCEGPDDMPAHVKAVLTGTDVTLPVRNGRLALGTWQGIYLCEHRNRASRRTLIATVQGSR